MKPRCSRRLIALVAGTTLATLLPSGAPASAAAMPGPAATAALNCTADGSHPVTRTLQATVINDGGGVARSGAAARTGVRSICMEMAWFGSLSSDVDASNNVSGAFVNSIGFNARPEGIGQDLPTPDLALEWPRLSDGSVPACTRYVATASASE